MQQNYLLYFFLLLDFLRLCKLFTQHIGFVIASYMRFANFANKVSKI